MRFKMAIVDTFGGLGSLGRVSPRTSDHLTPGHTRGHREIRVRTDLVNWSGPKMHG